MSFIQREQERLAQALRQTPAATLLFRELYAAQMALAWASDPTHYGMPSKVLLKDSSVLDMAEDLEGCPSSSNPEAS